MLTIVSIQNQPFSRSYPKNIQVNCLNSISPASDSAFNALFVSSTPARGSSAMLCQNKPYTGNFLLHKLQRLNVFMSVSERRSYKTKQSK